ncbi:MFS transporter [Streptococcus fryi]
MSIFRTNVLFRRLLINSWVSSFGDIIFYLGLMAYVSRYSFVSIAIPMITASEVLPIMTSVLTGAVADFQTRRIQKYISIAFIKFALYFSLFVILLWTEFSLLSVVIICVTNVLSDSLSYFASSMLTPIYFRIIKEDASVAMGFRQATQRIVSFLSQAIGGLLIGFVGIESFALFNAATFLLVFIGLLMIKKELSTFETVPVIEKRPHSLNHLFKHITTSVRVLLGFRRLCLTLLTLSFGSVIGNIVIPVVTLLLVHQSFYDFDNGKVLSVLLALFTIGGMIGSLLVSKFKHISIKRLVFSRQIVLLLIVLGFAIRNILLIAIGVFLFSCFVGILMPRLQEIVYRLMPSERIGTIESAIQLIDMLLPSLLSVVIVGMMSLYGHLLVSLFLGMVLIAMLILLNQFKILD